MRILSPFILLILLSLAASCTDDSGHDGPVDMIYWDIATFQGNNSGSATFTIRQVNDTPEATLTADRSITITDENDPTGKRMFISYIPESNEAYTSGKITLRSAALVNQSPIRVEDISEYPEWARDKVYLYSAWRTGRYLNFHVSLTYDREPRTFCIVADPATISRSYPDLYLVHIMDQPTEYHQRRYYASFDIAEIWDSPTVEGINLHVSNSNLDKQIFTFSKTN